MFALRRTLYLVLAPETNIVGTTVGETTIGLGSGCLCSVGATSTGTGGGNLCLVVV